jgi:hypothetical protein
MLKISCVFQLKLIWKSYFRCFEHPEFSGMFRLGKKGGKVHPCTGTEALYRPVQSLSHTNKLQSLLSHLACCYIYFIQNQVMHSFKHTPIFTFKTLKLLKCFLKHVIKILHVSVITVWPPSGGRLSCLVPQLQGVPGGKDLTSGECSLGQTIPI